MVLAEGNVGLAVVRLPLLWGVEGAVWFRNQVGTDNNLQCMPTTGSTGEQFPRYQFHSPCC